MLNRDRGKRNEKALAKRLGGKRVGPLSGEDIMTTDWSIEAKARVAFVGEGWMQQAERNCPKGKTPLVIVHLHHRPHGEDLVMMRLRDWELWNGELIK